MPQLIPLRQGRQHADVKQGSPESAAGKGEPCFAILPDFLVRGIPDIEGVEAAVDLRLIDGAKLLTDAAGTWQGKPARILILRAADRLDDDDAGKVKVAENKVTLWLDSENIPVAVEHLFGAKFSFLFLKGETKQKKSWHLARAADRLVRARYEYTQNSSGMGQKGHEVTVATVRVH